MTEAHADFSPGDILGLLVKVATDIGVVGKDSENTAQGRYKFRSIDALVNHAAPALRKHKVVVIPSHRLISRERIKSSGGSEGFDVLLESSFLFVAPDSSWVRSSTVGEGADYSDKAVNKAMSQALKYCLAQTLMIPTGDDDPDVESPTVGGAAKGPSRGSSPSRTTRKPPPTQKAPRRQATQELPGLYFTEEDREADGWFPAMVCPICGGAVEHTTIKTKNGESPIFKCTNLDCDTWPSHGTRKDGRFWPWSEFGEDEGKIWGPGGWVDDHLSAGTLVVEEWDPAYGPEEAPF